MIFLLIIILIVIMSGVVLSPDIPVKISEKLFIFLNKVKNIQGKETFIHLEITPIIIKYIKDNNLIDHNDARSVVVNNELRNLFNITDKRLSYREIAGYLYSHYTKVTDL